MSKLRIISESDAQFADRADAGRQLARTLKDLSVSADVILGVPRGGVVVANELARELDAELDVAVARKLGSPRNPELAVGAVSETGEIYLDEMAVAHTAAGEKYIQDEKRRAIAEIARRVAAYRDVRPKVDIRSKRVIVTDDGVATGATMRVIVWALRQQRPRHLVLALPVGPCDTLEELVESVDELICLRMPAYFGAVGQFYARFDQTQDAEVINMLKEESRRFGLAVGARRH